MIPFMPRRFRLGALLIIRPGRNQGFFREVDSQYNSDIETRRDRK
jgi:hypothetical protein